MQILDYKSPDPPRESKLAFAALVYGVVIGPISPILAWLVLGEFDDPWRYPLFALWLIVAGVVMGVLAANRAQRLKLRGKQVAYIGAGISVLWALLMVADYFHIIRII